MFRILKLLQKFAAMKKVFFTSIVFVLLSFFIGNFVNIFAQSPTVTPQPTSTQEVKGESTEKGKELQDKIQEYERKLTELQGTKKTLSSQISLMNTQIQLTELKIKATEAKINDLKEDVTATKNRITNLEKVIDNSSALLIERIEASYKAGRVDPLQVFATSNNFSNFLSRIKYLNVMQAQAKKEIYAAEQAKVNYAEQKKLLEEKEQEQKALQAKFSAYEDQLSSEKKNKQVLLDETQNDEKKYQQLLSQARAEYEAIQNIVSGGGAETEIGTVEEGQKIATIISGSSCNSSGAHTHFIVKSGGATQNPFSYLSSTDLENCSGSSCGSSDGDSANFGGSWRWPIEPKIKMNQGYGETWAVKNTWAGNIYRFHNGIDISSMSSNDVKAVKKGTLFRGSYAGSGGCRLRYVRLKHEDGLETFYLHVNYL